MNDACPERIWTVRFVVFPLFFFSWLQSPGHVLDNRLKGSKKKQENKALDAA